MTILYLLENFIGEYNYDLPIADWAWIMSAALLLLVVWGIIVIARSVISRV